MSQAVPIIGVGASAGGLEAIREMLDSAPADIELAFVVVQHLDPNHESLLAELLARNTKLPVRQISGGERIDAGHVYIIPPGHGLSIKDGRLSLDDFEQPRGLRRPIDDFLDSLAEDQGENCGCVILSGTGADGTTGLRAIKEHGGLCVAQDPDTARYDGMPVSAVGTGLVDFIKPPHEIVKTLRAFFDRRNDSAEREEAAEVVADHVDDMCQRLREAVGHDFAGYKRSTLVRRIERRMQVLDIDQPDSYLTRIRGDDDECEALFRDLLINVTRFFRDPEFYEVLNRRAIEPLVANASASQELRVWIPGCSSGEEAYSIAMLFAEALRGKPFRPVVQIFATDIDEKMLSIAREGRYPIAALADIPEELRERYTIGHEGSFQISPKVRDLIRFSSHSLVKDPPFSKVDLVSCRNLLIYFGDKLQQQVFPLLHYAIAPGGYLFLGPSESIGRHENLFSVLDQKARLFSRVDGKPTYPIKLPASIEGKPPSETTRKSYPSSTRLSWEESLSVRRIVDRYAPASMVVDPDGDIISSNGRLSKYFEFPNVGTANAFAPSLARPGLRERLSPLIRQASEERKRVVARDVEVTAEFGKQKVDIVADPLPDSTVLLVFLDAAPFEAGSDDDMVEFGPADSTVQQLEDELRLTRHRLRSTVEELETANEELKSSNEEMMSMNEELQSTNEELSTVNDELKSKIDQLTVANSDLRNFFDSTQLAVVVLDSDLSVRSFTDAATELFPLKSGDRGRSLAEVASLIDDVEFLEDARRVIRGKQVPARTVEAKNGEKQWALRILPYRVQDGTVDGATLVFTDVTAVLAMQSELERERERLKLAVRVAKIGVWEYNVDTGQTELDEGEQHLLGVDAGDDFGMDAILKRVHPDDVATVESSLRKAIAGAGDFDAQFRIILGDGEVRHLRGLGTLVAGSSPVRLVGVTFDISAEARLAEQREYLLREMNHRVKNLFAIISSLVSGAARTAETPKQLAEDVSARIHALGRAHALTQQPGEKEVPLISLVNGAMAPYVGSTRIACEGDEVSISVERITPLALILHEWATNSAKYGALGSDDGSVTIRWNRIDDASVRLTWMETVQSPHRPDKPKEGFGTRLVGYSAQQLSATIEQEPTKDGWRATIDMKI